MKVSDIERAAATADEIDDIKDYLYYANQAELPTANTFGVMPFEINVNGNDITSLIPFESLKKLVVDSLNQAVNERLLILKTMGVEIDEPATQEGIQSNVNQEQEAPRQPVANLSWGNPKGSAGYSFGVEGNKDDDGA